MKVFFEKLFYYRIKNYLCITIERKGIIHTQKIKIMTTLNTMTKEELLTFLAPLTKLAMQMIIAGTLRKNVVRHFTNKGLSLEVAENLTEIASFKAEQLLKNKAK